MQQPECDADVNHPKSASYPKEDSSNSPYDLYQFWWIYNPPGLNWGFSIPVPSRHIGSPHGVADCKSAGYLAAGLQIQPNEVSQHFLDYKQHKGT